MNKIEGAGCIQVIYDDIGKGNVILVNTSNDSCITVKQELLRKIFEPKCETKNEAISELTPEPITLMELLNLNFINKNAAVEIYSGSTAADDLLFSGSINDYLNDIKNESMLNDIRKEVVWSISNESNITIILLN